MTAVTVESNKIVSNAVKELHATRDILRKKKPSFCLTQ